MANEGQHEVIEAKMSFVKKAMGNGNYVEAYNILWSLMPILDDKEFLEQKVTALHFLGSLYHIFEQYDKAAQSIDESLELAEKEVRKGTKKDLLLSTILAKKAWLISNSNKDYATAKVLLKKALKLYEKNGREGEYVKMQLGQLYIFQDSLTKASQILHKIESTLGTKKKTKNSSLLFEHLGRLYVKKNDLPQAIYYLENSIKSIDKYQNHKDNQVDIYETLAECYAQLGQIDIAYDRQKSAKMLGDSLFGSRSSQNKVLFEIKNSYEEKIEQKEKTLWQLKAFIVLLSVLIGSVILVWLMKIKLRKAIKQQKLSEQKRAFEKQQKEEEIKFKNKELTTTALQIIERDTLLNDIKSKIAKLEFPLSEQKKVQDVLNSLKINKALRWDEFELYFTQVHDDFYNKLKVTYPSLTPTELKMCALIKLGFSSKDIAALMGIGVPGINTSRYRIRKKMNLEEGVNFTNFLKSLD
jgi:tetratricopeptide (TPR) repeat protein